MEACVRSVAEVAGLKEGAGMYTPWGLDCSPRQVAIGLFMIRAAHGGGYLLSDALATKSLSPPALGRAVRYHRYACFSYESGTWAIVALELGRYRDELLLDHDLLVEPEAYLTAVLSERHADYLIERGLEPDPEGLRLWERRRRAEELRSRRDPRLVVRALGGWSTGREDEVEVVTADGRSHRIDRQTYGRLDPLLRLLPPEGDQGPVEPERRGPEAVTPDAPAPAEEDAEQDGPGEATPGSTKLTVELTVVEREPTRALRAWLPERLVARVQLTAMRNKLRKQGPSTMQAIVVEALTRWLDEQDA